MIGLVLLVELVFVVLAWQKTPTEASLLASRTPKVAHITNTEALGNLLYTQYFYLFQAAGVILLIAMVGAIVLTLRERGGIRRQRISTQIGRTREESVEIKKISPRSGA